MSERAGMGRNGIRLELNLHVAAGGLYAIPGLNSGTRNA